MATGMAKGAHQRGKRIAFGDGQKIIWDHHSELIFRHNPNIAAPGMERSSDIEWINFYRGNRLYNREGKGRWIWNYDFKAIAGELYFSPDEQRFASRAGQAFIVIEPNVPEHKSVAENKRWPLDRYIKVTKLLRKAGHDVVQLYHGGSRYKLEQARQIKTNDFRQAAAVLKYAALYIGPEGGLHHASAALGIPAVVLFGGFIPPRVTGYDTHTNLTGGADACGSLKTCGHCAEAMKAISVPEVCDAAHELLQRVAA